MGAGDLKNVSLLKAGHHIGINTVGQSLRNANLQLAVNQLTHSLMLVLGIKHHLMT